jgi:hypothetical protein
MELFIADKQGIHVTLVAKENAFDKLNASQLSILSPVLH